MNSLDATFEALAPHYAGFGPFAAANGFWTVVALVTAALSFWRLLASSLPLPPPLPSDRASSSPAVESIPPPPRSSRADSAEATSIATSPVPKASAAHSACEADVVTKGRFIAYYREDDLRDAAQTAAAENDEEEEEKEVEVEVELRGDRRRGAAEWWGEGWEKALMLRTNGVGSGTGWYDYQDRTALGGVVVRLWEEERRRRRKGTESVIASPVTSSGRCCVVG